MRSTMRFEIARPRPVPPNLRVAEPSACSNSRKMRAWSRGAIPMPVSRTWKRMSPSRSPGSTMTATPPCSVNLMALPARLSSTWRSRAASPMTARAGVHRRRTRSRCLWPARAAPAVRPSPRPARRARSGRASRSSLPASILEKSSTSSISDSSVSPDVLRGLGVGRSAPASAACRAAGRPCRECR